ncbi:hypothetical protein N9S31_01470, partial [bacterium]|nr:hypothetical protein [bacterium]
MVPSSASLGTRARACARACARRAAGMSRVTRAVDPEARARARTYTAAPWGAEATVDALEPPHVRGLNDDQRAAVLAPVGATRVLAG